MDRRVYGLDDFTLQTMVLTYDNEVSIEITFDLDNYGRWFWSRKMMRKGSVDWAYSSVRRFEKLRSCVEHCLKHLELCSDSA
jgi:hypothetical protein